MRFISIEKAKPKFKQLYVVASKDGLFMGTLASTTATPDGLKHTFSDGKVDGDSTDEALYIAAIEDPRQKN